MEDKKTDVASSINPESPCRYCGKPADICFRLDPDTIAVVPLTAAGSAMLVTMGPPPKEPGEIYVCVGCMDQKIYSRDELFPLSMPKPGVA